MNLVFDVRSCGAFRLFELRDLHRRAHVDLAQDSVQIAVARRLACVKLRAQRAFEKADARKQDYVAALKPDALKGARIGIELRSFGLTADKYELVRQRLAGWCELVDAWC